MEQRARVDQLSFQLDKSENFSREKEAEITVLKKYIQDLTATKMDILKENEGLEELGRQKTEEIKRLEEDIAKKKEKIEDRDIEIKCLKEIKVFF